MDPRRVRIHDPYSYLGLGLGLGGPIDLWLELGHQEEILMADRRRDRLEIARDILKQASQGTGLTGLVYGANLNFNIIQKYLEEMEGAGLIEVEVLPGARFKLYLTTDWGHEFMRMLEITLALYKGLTWPEPQAPPLEVEINEN